MLNVREENWSILKLILKIPIFESFNVIEKIDKTKKKRSLKKNTDAPFHAARELGDHTKRRRQPEIKSIFFKAWRKEQIFESRRKTYF